MKLAIMLAAVLMSMSAFAQDQDLKNEPVDQQLKNLMKECNIKDEDAISALESSYELVLFNSTKADLNHKQVFAALVSQSGLATPQQVMDRYSVPYNVADAVLSNAREIAELTNGSPLLQVTDKQQQIPMVNYDNLPRLNECWQKLFQDVESSIRQGEEMFRLKNEKRIKAN